VDPLLEGEWIQSPSSSFLNSFLRTLCL
jgi:hypothetical protein